MDRLSLAEPRSRSASVDSSATSLTLIEQVKARDGEAAAKACADHIAQASALAQAALREEAGDAVAGR